ncbi:hypothetical protein DAPPUDRAFT_320336 [Daphnia pulex]|uniref:Uncharacterized protein n=1 Tax=Daphnia pulex TaxID=6669 RepID=E9GPK1_DAPPU|nr:hypothetical protein DAPPUDRAFT_337687 [Daphnia pulex]EFX78652.1 hypothetical protein DAPPUDRAFT_320336 [Daphnia pulex]|eukprot:EFX61985.1 hypothetical protein DAPPUDRAFT_337687 [Daphnia pulex]
MKPGCVPSGLAVELKIVKEFEPTVIAEVTWSRPTESYGELKGYICCATCGYKDTSDMPDSDNNMIEMMRIDGTQVSRRLTEGLERRLELAGRN